MIVTPANKLISKVVTPSPLPATTGSLLRKHVEHGAILYTVVDEELWMVEDTAIALYQSLEYMLELGASPHQCMLVLVLMDSTHGRTYDQLRYWQRSGGVGIAVEDSNLTTFFKNEELYIEGK